MNPSAQAATEPPLPPLASLPATPAGGAQAGAPLTVGEIVARLRSTVERQFPHPVWVEGEVRNCTYHQSGHIYFSLLDPKATDRFGQSLVLPCAFFRGMNQDLKFKLADGMNVLCLGQVTIYEGRAQYQLKILRVEPRGTGALQLAFEQLKKRLQAEGLFDESRKRPIPSMPGRVGIITSPSGSAVHDMVSKLRGVFHVTVIPVKVQGEGASADIAGAIELANRLQLADVLIVGRGGGSIEDLWAFNEEPVARAIFRSRIPVISAVGHQDDWTIADYVADLRASTPTDAAKRLVHEQELFADQCREQVDGLVDVMRRFLDDHAQHLDALTDRLRLLHPKNQLERYEASTRELEAQLIQSMRYVLGDAQQRLEGLAGRLDALSPLAVLARGYSITMQLPGHRVVTDASAVAAGDEIETLLARGRIRSSVSQVVLTREQESDGADA
jgi:exodeoxyribonuclease VII large subunit